MKHPEVTTFRISSSMEDYLKTIYRLTTGNNMVSTSALARQMGCSPASITAMLQKLSNLKLVNYERYQGVTLTKAGNKIALETIRHHRLIELYLTEILGYSWDRVHDEAEQLEHVISEEFEERIDKALGYPTLDPHGDPIPTKEGTIDSQSLHSLWDTKSGENVQVAHVSDGSPEVLRYLASIGVLPKVGIHVRQKKSPEGPIRIKIKATQHLLGEELARQIFVLPI